MSNESPRRSLFQLYGAIGGNTTRSRNDPRVYTAAARRAFYAKFEEEADPRHELSLRERRRRGEALRKVHMQKMTVASLAVRTAKREAAEVGAR